MNNAETVQKEPGFGVMLALLTCSMLILMGGAAVAPGLPRIEEHFSNSGDLVSFVITLPHLAVAFVGFLMGIVSDRFGKVRTLVASLLVFIVTGTGSYFLDDIVSILVLRFLLGFGLAGIVCTVTSLIGSYYTGHKRVKMLGLQSASMGVGVLVLEVIGGTLSDIGWNAPFLVYLIAVPFLVLALLFLREPAAETERRTEEDGTKTDMKLLSVIYMTIFVGMIIIFLVPTKMPSYMEGVLGVSAGTMGLFLGFHGIGNAVFSLLHRRFVQSISSFYLIVASFLLLAFSLVLPEVLGDEIYAGVLTLVISGFAVGLMVPSVVGCIVGASTPSNSGKMMGIYAVFLNLGQFAVSLITIPALSAVNGNYPELFFMFAMVSLFVAIALAAFFAVSTGNKKSY